MDGRWSRPSSEKVTDSLLSVPAAVAVCSFASLGTVVTQAWFWNGGGMVHADECFAARAAGIYFCTVVEQRRSCGGILLAELNQILDGKAQSMRDRAQTELRVRATALVSGVHVRDDSFVVNCLFWQSRCVGAVHVKVTARSVGKLHLHRRFGRQRGNAHVRVSQLGICREQWYEKRWTCTGQRIDEYIQLNLAGVDRDGHLWQQTEFVWKCELE